MGILGGFKMNMKYVLDNELERKQCKECLGMWVCFNHEGQKAFYRLSPVAPRDCSICKPIDEEIEAKSIMSVEQWIGEKE